MKSFLWAIALFTVGFVLARLYRKGTTLTAPSPPAYAEGQGTSVDYR